MQEGRIKDLVIYLLVHGKFIEFLEYTAERPACPDEELVVMLLDIFHDWVPDSGCPKW